MRHPHYHTLHAALAGQVNDGLEGRDERLAAFQAESLLRRPLPLEELLEPAGRPKPLVVFFCCFFTWQTAAAC